VTIAPIRKTVQVKSAPEAAFTLFTGHIHRWWPAGIGIGAAPRVDLVIEPGAGGRWFERSADGAETPWGRVMAWEPPHRVLLAWQIGEGWRYDPALETEIEVVFEAHAGGTRVTLEHRHLERLGAQAAQIAQRLAGGWPGIVEGFAVWFDAAHSDAEQPETDQPDWKEDRR
jgi:uncharacterized protein YndB with AHSA1/START domain